MTEEMQARVQEIIEYKVNEAIEQGWIDDRINLTTFCGWMGEAMNYCGEEGVYDAWQEFDKEKVLEYYCWLLEMKEAIAGWDWDYAHQNIVIKKVEE